jgi:hypothetical protein
VTRQHFDVAVIGAGSAGLAARRLGVRERRRARGEYRLEASDLLSGATSHDAIALATWPMELRERAAAMLLRFPERDRSAPSVADVNAARHRFLLSDSQAPRATA